MLAVALAVTSGLTAWSPRGANAVVTSFPRRHRRHRRHRVFTPCTHPNATLPLVILFRNKRTMKLHSAWMCTENPNRYEVKRPATAKDE